MFSGLIISNNIALVIELVIIGILLFGIAKFRTPPGARLGNHAAVVALLAAMAMVLVTSGSQHVVLLTVVIVVGLFLGYLSAYKIDMKQMPALIAIQNGAGGLASCLVSLLEMTKAQGDVSVMNGIGGYLGVVLGAFTLSGSVVAAMKLNNRLRNAGKSAAINPMLVVTAIAAVALCVVSWGMTGTTAVVLLAVIAVLSLVVGYLFAVRIGGADMPVVISFLNSFSGLAAAFTGVVLGSRLLIVFGATVGSSGFILTQAMCKAMNRSLLNLFVGTAAAGRKSRHAAQDAGQAAAADEPAESVEAAEPVVELTREQKVAKVAAAARDAKNVVFIPGYGMALAQAQFAVVGLANALEKMGKHVVFAIHPVAGRMPGHMNVLLAEADVDYEKLIEMDEINPKFATTDLVFVVGACDVVNSAAIHKEGTPISGMPVLLAHESKMIAVCNLDARPGYSGVDNPLYEDPKTVMLLGDAKATVEELTSIVTGAAQA